MDEPESLGDEDPDDGVEPDGDDALPAPPDEEGRELPPGPFVSGVPVVGALLGEEDLASPSSGPADGGSDTFADGLVRAWPRLVEGLRADRDSSAAACGYEVPARSPSGEPAVIRSWSEEPGPSTTYRPTPAVAPSTATAPAARPPRRGTAEIRRARGVGAR